MKRKKRTNKNHSQYTVPCPRKFQKVIIKNMQRSAKNKFNKSRTQKASKLLSEIKSTDKQKIKP